MKVPIFSPVSISIIERMEIDFDVSEATYIKKKQARGILYISPLIKEKESERLRAESERSHSSSSDRVPEAQMARRELAVYKKSPYAQYSFFTNPPRPLLDHIFSRTLPSQEDQDISLGFLLLGGVESVDFSEDTEELSQGVFEVCLEKGLSRKLITELDKNATKKVGREFPFQVNLTRIKNYVENQPEMRKHLFATSSTYEIREPIAIRPSVRDFTDVMTQLDGHGPRAEIAIKLAQKKIELEKKGITGSDMEREMSVYKWKTEEEMRERLRKEEKFFGKVAIQIEVENISKFPARGNILIEELALNFPINFSDYQNYPSEINFRYDPVRMQAIWSNISLSRPSEDASGDERYKTLFLLVPHTELSKVEKITGEIRMWLMVEGNEDGGPPLISYLWPQQICDPRGIPIKEDLQTLGYVDVKSGSHGNIIVDTSAIHKRRIYDTQRVMEFEDKSPRKAYELCLNILNSMAVEIYYQEEPREATTIGRDDVKRFHAVLRGSKYAGATALYIDLIVEGDIFTVTEAKISTGRRVKTRLKKIPKEHGNTRITFRGVASDLQILNDFADQVRDDISNQIASIT